MLYAKYIRSVEMVSQQGTASVKLTVAGETANKMRHEYVIGGDTNDLLVLIDKIKRQKADPSFRIVAKTYTKNGRVYNSAEPGRILFYSYQRVDFGELHYSGEYLIKMGARAGQTVSNYKVVAPDLWRNVDNLFNNDRARFDALSAPVRDAFLMGTLCAPPAGWQPAICDPDTFALLSAAAPTVIPVDDIDSQEEQDAIDNLNESPESPESDDGNPLF